MTPSQLDLARRLAAHPAFAWAPGMAGVSEDGVIYRVFRDRPGGRLLAQTEWMGIPGHTVEWDWLVRRGRVLALVLDDGPTKGALLAMVRAVYRDPGMFARPRGSRPRPDWVVCVGATSDIVCAAPTEGEALALALLEVL